VVSITVQTFGQNRYSSFDNMQLLIFCEIGLKRPIHAPKIGFCGGGQNRERGSAMLTPTNSFLRLGVVTSVPRFCKNRSRNATVRVRTDRQTYIHTDTKIALPLTPSHGVGRNSNGLIVSYVEIKQNRVISPETSHILTTASYQTSVAVDRMAQVVHKELFLVINSS